MRYVLADYDRAIESLQLAREALVKGEADFYCAICTDFGHSTHLCPFNPLVAVEMCEQISAHADRLHDAVHTAQGGRRWPENHLTFLVHGFLHFLCGACFYFGQGMGPRYVVSPWANREATAAWERASHRKHPDCCAEETEDEAQAAQKD